MFLLDSLMISGIRWTLETVLAAADAELNDDGALRDQMLDALQRRELGEISEERYAEIEADLLARIRDIKVRREGGQGPFAFGRAESAGPGDDSRIQVEASVAGDFHAPPPAPVTGHVDDHVVASSRVAPVDRPVTRKRLPRAEKSPRATKGSKARGRQ